MKCAHCQIEFPERPWPATRNKHCSKACTKRAWYERNKETVIAKAYEFKEKYPDKVRAAKRKWNNSEKGKLNREQWAKEHPDKVLNTIMKPPDWRERIAVRAKSRQLLIESGHVQICQSSLKSPHGGQLQCHHKDENPYNMELANLEWLCKWHHAEEHRIPDTEVKVNSFELAEIPNADDV